MIKTFLIFSPILFIICGFPLLKLKGINRFIGKILIVFGFINILLNYLFFKNTIYIYLYYNWNNNFLYIFKTKKI